MTEIQNSLWRSGFHRDDLTEYSEAELLAAARSGRPGAFGELWVRHEQVALAVARQVSSKDADDLVAEAFARVLRALRVGKGPTEHFRGYLCATVRTCAVDTYRKGAAPTIPLDDPAAITHADPESDPAEWSDDARRAWQSLSRQHRWLLWASAIEGYDVTEMAQKLGAKPGTVAVWLFRARERLRAAFLEGHVEPSHKATCQKHRDRFVPYLRDTLGAKRRTETEAHLLECVECTQVLANASQVNRKLRVAIWPALPVAAKLAIGSAPALALGRKLGWHHAMAKAATAKVAAVGVAAVTAVVVPAVVVGPLTDSDPPAVVRSLPEKVSDPLTKPSEDRATPDAPAPSEGAPTLPGGSPSESPSPEPTPVADPGSPPPTDTPLNRLASPCSGQGLTNPGFESGTTGWSATNGVIWTDGQYSHTGQGWAWLGGQPVPVTETLTQTVDIQAGCQATLSYWLRISSAQPTNSPIDTLTLKVNGTKLQSFSNADECVYGQRTVDLSSYAGQSVTITWTAVQATSTGTSFWIDDTALTIS